jgi:hypothetical protein
LPHAAKVAARHVHVVNLPASLAQEQERTGHREFDVIGMGRNGKRAAGRGRSSRFCLRQGMASETVDGRGG